MITITIMAVIIVIGGDWGYNYSHHYYNHILQFEHKLFFILRH